MLTSLYCMHDIYYCIQKCLPLSCYVIFLLKMPCYCPIMYCFYEDALLPYWSIIIFLLKIPCYCPIMYFLDDDLRYGICAPLNAGPSFTPSEGAETEDGMDTGQVLEVGT
jgi:hypothetical protein